MEGRQNQNCFWKANSTDRFENSNEQLLNKNAFGRNNINETQDTFTSNENSSQLYNSHHNNLHVPTNYQINQNYLNSFAQNQQYNAHEIDHSQHNQNFINPINSFTAMNRESLHSNFQLTNPNYNIINESMLSNDYSHTLASASPANPSFIATSNNCSISTESHHILPNQQHLNEDYLHNQAHRHQQASQQINQRHPSGLNRNYDMDTRYSSKMNDSHLVDGNKIKMKVRNEMSLF
jgi:hypothetical protein